MRCVSGVGVCGVSGVCAVRVCVGRGCGAVAEARTVATTLLVTQALGLHQCSMDGHNCEGNVLLNANAYSSEGGYLVTSLVYCFHC